MKRIVLFWIPLLLLLLVNCTTESFDFGDQEGILVGGSGGQIKSGSGCKE